MSRLLVHVEGQTEESFVNQLLRDYLVERGYHSVSARLLGNARQRDRRGGIRRWLTVRTEILRRLEEDPGCIATTMVDFYGLPAETWPGHAEAASAGDATAKSDAVTEAMRADLMQAAGDRLNPKRFVPFVIMHEFEGLLFSDCAGFSRGIGQPELEPRLADILSSVQSPEEINDDPQTAPSKRVVALVPSYNKALFGPLAAREIGLDAIREACPVFRQWLDRLVALV